MNPHDPSAAQAALARSEDPALRVGVQATLQRVVAWRWTRDEPVTTGAPFEVELAGGREPRWQEDRPASVDDWVEYGFDASREIVAWRVYEDGVAEAIEMGARFALGSDVVEVTLRADGAVASLLIETRGAGGCVRRTAELGVGQRPSADYPVQEGSVRLVDYDYDGARAVRRRSVWWTAVIASFAPPELTAAELQQPPWSVLGGLVGTWTAQAEPDLQAEYDGDRLVRLTQHELGGSTTLAWAASSGQEPRGVPDLATAEDRFAAALASAIAEDAAANPVRGPLRRAVVRWFTVEQPDYFTVQLLGDDERDHTTAGADAWLPLEWANADRELERTDRITANPDLAAAAALLAERYEADAERLGDAWHQGDGVAGGASRAIWEAIRRLPEALGRRGVAVHPEFAATATHFEAYGGLDILRATAAPEIVAALAARGELPEE